MMRVTSLYTIVWILILMIFIAPASYAQNKSSDKGETLISDQQKIDFGTIRNPEISSKMITITNRGTKGIKWVARTTDPWLALDKNGGIIEDAPVTMTVTLNSYALQPGKQESKIIVTSTSGTIIIPVFANLLTEKGTDAALKLKTIFIRSDSEFLDVGKKLIFTAFGRYSDGSQKDITKDVKWISTDKKIGKFVDPGALKGESVGDIKVYVVFGNARSQAVTVSTEEAEGPILRVTPTAFVLGNTENGTVKDLSITIRRRGKGELVWEAVTTLSWLSLSKKVSPEESEIWGAQRYMKRISGTGTAGITITVNPEDLEEGKQEGEILIKSNGGEEQISLSMNIVTLKSLSISPVAIKIGVGQKRNFRVIGIWSDGSRTDLSRASEGEWILSDPVVGSFQRNRSVFLAQRAGRVELFRIRGNMASNSAVVGVEEIIPQPVLLVAPREVDLGSIGQSEHARAVYTLKNVGSGKLFWWTDGPEGWLSSDRRSLEGTIDNDMRSLRLFIETEIGKKDSFSLQKKLYPVTIKVGVDNDYVTFKRDLPLGTYRERVVLTSNGGRRNIFLTFAITDTLSRPRLEIRPHGLDLGKIEAGKQLMKKIEVRNSGKDELIWRARLQGNRKSFRGVALTKGKYVSLFNDDIAGLNAYEVPRRLAKDIEMSGRWSQNEGFPLSQNEGDHISYSFKGTGIALFVTKDEQGGSVDLAIDGKSSMSFDCSAEKRERAEFIVVTKLDEGDHRLRITNKGGRVELEGMRVYSDNLVTGRSGWIRLFPDRGTIKGEVDYINVMINSKNLMPGSYCENILFYSDGGTEVTELSLEIEDKETAELIDIYRYVRGDDTLLTGDAEPVEGYKREKVAAFKLFRKGTPGTIEFYGWYNREVGDHFYSSDRSGGGKDLAGYDFEGSIGNIATLKLSNTRELFRWFNPEKCTHFYTTDTKGEGRPGDGYKYDGLSGYVR